VNPGEFFAVATEVFFDLPGELLAQKPALYGVLRDFYRQDPARREQLSATRLSGEPPTDVEAGGRA
jgi:Mlc titration factor MtfA (ptsG expression regulator)